MYQNTSFMPWCTILLVSHPKDWVPDNENCNVIYKISCDDCDVGYVGQTGRPCKTQLAEHQPTVKYKDSSSSALSQHSTCFVITRSHK